MVLTAGKPSRGENRFRKRSKYDTQTSPLGSTCMGRNLKSSAKSACLSCSPRTDQGGAHPTTPGAIKLYKKSTQNGIGWASRHPPAPPTSEWRANAAADLPTEASRESPTRQPFKATPGQMGAEKIREWLKSARELFKVKTKKCNGTEKTKDV
ncbi:hypothetical protein B0H17DRAFT_1144481 [Mycena rosella]|uniref:Uncharacterized protein n=1 Tax=Mycena rosella TaxID=1033263 RepID=A0AAD7CT31_MYCRO|nr:hypothetical protein B0H17DRAFT_1144481 [Mycena rosella]